MTAFLSMLWLNIVSVLRTFRPENVLDIIVVAYLIYKGLQLVRETRAEQLLKGILLLLVVYLFSWQIGLTSVAYIINTFFQFGVIALCVVFQPELRRALERLGRSKIGNISLFQGFGSADEEEARRKTEETIRAVTGAACALSETKTGALIVLERKTKLGEIISTGTVLDAKPGVSIICNIFFNKAPLHDGAMVIREGRVWAAGCFLPLSDTQRISRDLGTRHRAALGASENSDALVVVVSEETGTISIAENGKLTRPYTEATLKAALERGLLPPSEEESDKKIPFLGRNTKGKGKFGEGGPQEKDQ